MKNKKCIICGKKATRQTAKGKDNVKAKGHPNNNGYYCDECFRKGLEDEEEAMYDLIN